MSDELKELQRRRAEQKALLDESLRGKTEEERLIIKQTPAYKNNLNLLREINEQVKEIQENNKVVVDNLIDQESKLKGLKGIQASLVTLDRERLKAQQSLDSDAQDGLNSIAALNQELLAMSAEDVIGRELKLKSINEQIDALKASGTVSADLIKNLEDQRDIANEISGLTEKQQEFLGKQLEAYDAIKDSVAGVFETLSLLTSGPAGFFGSALIGAGMFADKLGETTKALGGMRDIGTTALSFIDENAVENAKALSKEFGGMNNVTLELQASTSLIASNMGISGVEASSLLGTFSRLNGNSSDVAKDLMVSTQEFAKQNGIIPSELMGELASNTEAFAIYGKDGGKNIIQAAGYAKKLGVEFDKLVGIADSLLDFESSITKELELGAMLGKNINLDKARQLAFAGDIEGATKETLNALGGIEAFNKMDPIAKQAAADLLGLQASELEKMVNNQKEADTLSGQLNEKFSFMSESTSYIANEWGGGILKAFGSGIIAVGQMGAGFSTMGINLGGVIKGTAQVLKNLLGMVAGPVLNGLKMAGTFLANTGVGKAIGGLKDRLMAGVTNRITTPPPTPTIPDTANPASRGGLMDSLSKIKMSDVLKGAAAMLIVAAAVFVFGKAVQEFMKVEWSAVGMAVVSMLALVGAIALLGMIMSSGVGAVAILAGAAAMLIVASAVLILGFALQAIGKGFEMLSTGIETLLPNLVGVAQTIASLVVVIPAIAALSVSLLGLSYALMALGVAGLLATPGLLLLSFTIQPLLKVFQALGSVLDSVGSNLSAISESISSLVMFIPAIAALSLSLMGLSASLISVGLAGVLAAPGLMALSAVGTVATGLGSVLGLGGGEGEGGETDNMKILVDEIRGLREDLRSGKIGVYMDGTAVSSKISKVVDRIGVNSYS
jgi:hypothetical protein